MSNSDFSEENLNIIFKGKADIFTVNQIDLSCNPHKPEYKYNLHKDKSNDEKNKDVNYLGECSGFSINNNENHYQNFVRGYIDENNNIKPLEFSSASFGLNAAKGEVIFNCAEYTYGSEISLTIPACVTFPDSVSFKCTLVDGNTSAFYEGLRNLLETKHDPKYDFIFDNIDHIRSMDRRERIKLIKRYIKLNPHKSYMRTFATGKQWNNWLLNTLHENFKKYQIPLGADLKPICKSAEFGLCAFFAYVKNKENGNYNGRE